MHVIGCMHGIGLDARDWLYACDCLYARDWMRRTTTPTSLHCHSLDVKSGLKTTKRINNSDEVDKKSKELIGDRQRHFKYQLSNSDEL